MIWSLPLLTLCIYTIAADYTSMECVSDSGWLNGYDAAMTAQRSGYFLSGQESVHNNHNEDRTFKWDYCKPVSEYGDIFVGSETSLSQTSYDATWTKECSGNAALTYAYSTHHNHYEDRLWTFKCQNLDESKFELTGCSWTGYVNSMDGDVNYQCGANGVLQGIGAQHNNHNEDRQWKFECCLLQDVAAVDLTCIDDDEWTDNFEGSATADGSTPTHFVSGQYMGPGKWKWKFCGSTEALFDTENILDPVIESSISCEPYTNAVLVGAVTTDSHAFHTQFKCGTLTSHTLDESHCQVLQTVQLTQQSEENFECPNNGVVRTIERYVDVDGEVTWQFMCCNLLLSASSPGNFLDFTSYNYGIKEKMVYIMGGLLCLLLMVNVVVLAKSWCCKSSKTRYKVVSMQSTDDEV